MSDSPAGDTIAIEKRDRAIIARPQKKMMDDAELKALGRVIDDASPADAPVPLVLIDLSQVGLLPSLALGLLVQMSNKCKSRNQKLKLVGVQPQVRKVFSITKLDRVFEFAPSIDAAFE